MGSISRKSVQTCHTLVRYSDRPPRHWNKVSPSGRSPSCLASPVVDILIVRISTAPKARQTMSLRTWCLAVLPGAVHECCYGMTKFDSPPLQNHLTDDHQNFRRLLSRRWAIYYVAKIYRCRTDQGFLFHVCAIPRPVGAKVISAFLLGSYDHPKPRRLHWFWHKIRQKTQFRTKIALIRVFWCMFGFLRTQTSVQSNLARGRITVLTSLTAAKAFVCVRRQANNARCNHA